MSAYSMAGTVDFGSDAKQELLELRSENARLHLLTLLFRAAHQADGAGRARPAARALKRQGALLLRELCARPGRERRSSPLLRQPAHALGHRQHEARELAHRRRLMQTSYR